jgi:predicted phosphodiesterase
LTRLALIADLHGNLLALEAVLADLAREGVERVVCLGDVAATGPQPHETVARLRALDCPVVMGNADAWLFDPPAAASDDPETRRIEEIDRWCAAQLSDADLAFLRDFRPTVSVPLPGGSELLCCHGSPRSYDDILRATTPAAQLDALLGGAPPTLLAGGHTHERLYRRHGPTTLINPGSVGMSSDPPWAEYALVSAPSESLRVEFRRARFDLDAFIATIECSGMPHADWLADAWRRPPE